LLSRWGQGSFLAFAVAHLACGRAGEAPPSPLIELPLLAPIDPARPFNHSSETTLVAKGGHVTVAAIDLHLDAIDGFGEATLLRKVATVTSHDGGLHFGAAVDPGGGASTSDPIVRAGDDGTVWAAALDTDSNNSATLVRSDDHGDSWSVVARDLPTLDKEWLVVDSTKRVVHMASTGGFFTLSYDGAILFSTVTSAYAEAGCAGEGGAVFAVRNVGSLDSHIVSIDERSPPVVRGPDIGAGDAAIQHAAGAVSLGRTGDAGYFVLHPFKSTTAAEVRLLLRPTLDQPGTELTLSRSDAIAFHPAGAVDAAGRLHAVWYESDGPTGALVYVRSHSARLDEGFSTPRVIDPNACPGSGFYPGEPGTEPAGGRRLREYIDVAVDGSRVHFAWTHAPSAPSRVYTSHLDFE
jgi:hypothetical protein